MCCASDSSRVGTLNVKVTLKRSKVNASVFRSVAVNFVIPIFVYFRCYGVITDSSYYVYDGRYESVVESICLFMVD